VYWTNSLYSTWDDQFYPYGIPSAMVKASVGENGGITLDKDFYVKFPDNQRQNRAEGQQDANHRHKVAHCQKAERPE
ncbi:selenium-binding protein SBP56-related protein, partial [Rhizobium ruizarguesonis]